MPGMRAAAGALRVETMGLTLRVRPGEDSIMVAVGGEVDVCTVGLLQDALLSIMREGAPKLLLDISGVSFMDCAGLRVLMTIQRRAELRGGFMRLTAVPRAVRRIIELTDAHEALAGERGNTNRSVQFLPTRMTAAERTSGAR